MTLQDLIREAWHYGLSPDSVVIRIPGKADYADALTYSLYPGTTIPDTEQGGLVERENVLFIA